MEFRQIEGKKLGSLHYESDGFRYVQSSSSTKSMHLRCTLWMRRGIELPGTERVDRDND